MYKVLHTVDATGLISKEKGILSTVLTCGGAYLWGIDKRIEERTGIQVRIAEDAKSCVAIGTGEALDNMEVIRRSQLNRRETYI